MGYRWILGSLKKHGLWSSTLETWILSLTLYGCGILASALSFCFLIYANRIIKVEVGGLWGCNELMCASIPVWYLGTHIPCSFWDHLIIPCKSAFFILQFFLLHFLPTPRTGFSCMLQGGVFSLGWPQSTVWGTMPTFSCRLVIPWVLCFLKWWVAPFIPFRCLPWCIASPLGNLWTCLDFLSALYCPHLFNHQVSQILIPCSLVSKPTIPSACHLPPGVLCGLLPAFSAARLKLSLQASLCPTK